MPPRIDPLPRIAPTVKHPVTVNVRTVYVDASAAPRALTTCEVIDVSGLMRELIETLAAVDRKTQTVRYGRSPRDFFGGQPQ